MVIRVLLRIVDRMLSRSQNLGSVGGYIRSVVRIALWFLLVLVVADSLGIPVASMIALLSVAGLAISLAAPEHPIQPGGGTGSWCPSPSRWGTMWRRTGWGHGHFHRPGVQHPGHRGQQEVFIPNSPGGGGQDHQLYQAGQAAGGADLLRLLRCAD